MFRGSAPPDGLWKSLRAASSVAISRPAAPKARRGADHRDRCRDDQLRSGDHLRRPAGGGARTRGGHPAVVRGSGRVGRGRRRGTGPQSGGGGARADGALGQASDGFRQPRADGGAGVLVPGNLRLPAQGAAGTGRPGVRAPGPPRRDHRSRVLHRRPATGDARGRPDRGPRRGAGGQRAHRRRRPRAPTFSTRCSRTRRRSRSGSTRARIRTP